MNFYIAVTNNKWYDYLSKIKPDEVNFWRPSGLLFKSLQIGSPFLFKLHSPLNFITGGGFFIRSVKLPLSLAWDAFEDKNGTPTQKDLRNLIKEIKGMDEFDPIIGCTILNEPFFLPRRQWIPAPEDWSPNIVSGKTYKTDTYIGRKIWDTVQGYLQRLINRGFVSDVDLQYDVEEAKYGQEYLIKSRLGHGAFRILVTNAYKNICAISGEKALPVLEASHIKPFSEKGPNKINNGLLLRSDIHKLLDKGYLTLTQKYRVEVSRKIKEDFDNGKNYYQYHGKPLFVLPERLIDRPNIDYINWHNINIYRG